jgi:hypothetical protein
VSHSELKANGRIGKIPRHITTQSPKHQLRARRQKFKHQNRRKTNMNLKIIFSEQTEKQLKELRIDSIRENNERTYEQIISDLIGNEFHKKHDTTADDRVLKKNNADHEQKTNCIMFIGEECWNVNQIRDYIEKNYCTISTSFIYKLCKSGNLQNVFWRGKYISKVADVKNFFEKYFDSLQNKKRISTQKKTKIKRERTEEELEAMRARAAHARLSIGKSKQNIAATEALLS